MKKKLNIERILALILLTPAILSVFLFITNLLFSDLSFSNMTNLSSQWTGDYYSNSGGSYGRGSSYTCCPTGGGGYTSAAPIYLGLMAIAGALLLKKSSPEK